ncbi:MAG TPA: hypothetical protein VMY37_26830 [Thermoguttaceae bacterium]|nr:hypothetical protein [Thermoguttaceae bacterium]
MKKWLPHVLLVVLLVGLALALRSRDRLPETPEQTVTEFFTAAGDGDDRAYLRLVTGELRKSLEQARSEAGAEAFRQGLRRSSGGIKGLAVTRADNAPAPLAAVDVEIVFADRNERQRMLLAPIRGGWAIASLEQAQMVKPPIAYGTPVFDMPEPEDSQEQGGQSLQASPEP